jgi:Glycosyltransferase family 87/WD40-like Beta Propeller Repeat
VRSLPDAIALPQMHLFHLEMRISLEDSVSSHVDLTYDRDAGFGPDSGPGWGRWIRIGEWVLVALLAVHFGIRSLPRAWGTVNTDFPDYFVAASLVHEHYDTSRVYEWIWFERQKDHRDVDQRIVNLAPSTPFSTLAVYPLTGLSALSAKHCWIVINFGLLIAALYLVRAMTQLSWRRIALVAALSIPLRTNFLTGQYYVLLLFLLTLACYLYLRQKRFVAGVIVGIAAGLKIFPVVYLLYFLRRRDLKAFAGGVVGGLGSAVTSVVAFGWEANRTYLFQVLPATLRGEAMAPYALKVASLAALLHRLFVYEPQLNPHPALHAAWLFAVLHPLLQMAVMAPALLLVAPSETSSRRVRLEWAAILLASLAISTTPGAYLFTLLILPACVVLGELRGRKSYISVVFVLLLYVAAGYLSGVEHGGEGWSALVGVPRLYALFLSCVLLYGLMMRQQSFASSTRDRLAWAIALGVVVAVSISGNLRHQRGIYDDYQWRMSTPKEAYRTVGPAVDGDAVLFVAMLGDGYQSATERAGVTQFSGTSHVDELAVAAANGGRWVEQSGHASMIVASVPGSSSIPQAESPVASFDGRWMAFLREDHGRGRIWVRSLGQLNQAGVADRPITPPEFNVTEMSFLPSGELIFAAASGGRLGLFATDAAGGIQALGVEDVRYPAVSPDGRWLAYSQLQGGSWNLWLRDLTSGQTQRLTHAECNTTEPAWAEDSQTLVYASDCGRALSFFALSKRRVVPLARQ